MKKNIYTFKHFIHKDDLNNVNESNSNILNFNELYSKISKFKDLTGVVNIEEPNINSYDSDGNFKFYNNVFYIQTEDTNLYRFNLEQFNKHDAGANFDKFNKYLDKKSQELDSYVNKIENIKNAINDIKNIVNEINKLEYELSQYDNFKKLEYSYWKNDMLMVTVYVDVNNQ